MNLNKALNVKLKNDVSLIDDWDSSVVVDEVSLLIKNYSDSVKIYNLLRKSKFFNVDYFVKGCGLHYVVVSNGKTKINMGEK